MSDKIYVFGHKNPDTDSILAPLVYAEYLRTQGHDAEAVKIGPINNESKHLLNIIKTEKPRRIDSLPAGSKIFLVDHNTKKQTIDNIDELEIVGLIDHHNFGNFLTHKPIFARVEPLACTMSVFYKIFKEQNFEITQHMAKLMVSAILSDTLFFKSPTTTEEDKIIVKELNKIAQIEDLEAYSMAMFEAKSDLGDIPAHEIVKKDFKEFDVNGVRFAIGVMETTNPDYALSRKDKILEAMEHIKQQDELNFILFSVIDILEEINTTFVLGAYEEKIINKVFGANTTDHLANLGNRVSRKKQLIPDLNQYFNTK